VSDGAGGIIDGRERTGIGDRSCASGYGWTIHTAEGYSVREDADSAKTDKSN
jgi:hypothetical protein